MGVNSVPAHGPRRLVFSAPYAFFGTSQVSKSFPVSSLRTLSQKHPG